MQLLQAAAGLDKEGIQKTVEFIGSLTSGKEIIGENTDAENIEIEEILERFDNKDNEETTCEINNESLSKISGYEENPPEIKKEPKYEAPVENDDIQQSLKNISKTKSKKCECDIAFEDKNEKVYHIKTVHKNYFNCESCKKAFKKEEQLNTHISSHYKEKNVSHVCEECGFVASCKGNLGKHKQFQHDTVPQECEICSREFRGTLRLKLHKKRYHLNSNVCCRKTFDDEDQLQSHIDDHAKRKNNPLICDECGYTGSSKNNVDSHKALKHDTQTHVCDICSKDFQGLVKLQIHRRRFHVESKSCPHCKGYFKKSNLARHFRTAHTKESEKKYQCQQCEKGFIDITSLSVHMISVHSDKKPFTCRYSCGFAASDPGNRNKHEKGKHGEKYKPYKG